jgi:hypothetical protein
VAVFLSVWLLFLTRLNEPVYQGRRLGSWLRGHPREYIPAVLAVGTNALPYLLAELQATDSAPARYAERMLAKASVGPFWRTARDRSYHAGLGLQILDTNAVPALVNLIFAQPMQTVEGDPGYSAAAALKCLPSTEAQRLVAERLALALSSPDTMECRNACLALSLWPRPDEDIARSLAALSRSPNATVRAAAVRAIIFSQWNEELFLPALVLRLEDEQAAVRRLAIEGFRLQRSNAMSALPALRAAYLNELTQSTLRDDLRDGAFVVHTWSAREIRWAIRDAIKDIDPSAAMPVDPP